MPDPKNPGDKVKAHRFRKAIANGQKLQPVDQLWLAEYEEKLRGAGGAGGAAPSKNYGRSRSGRTVKFEMQEAAEAEGTGNAAREAAVAALQAKEEGRRLDFLTLNAVNGYKQLVADQRAMMAEMRRNERSAQRRAEIYEATHVAMLEAWRVNFISRVETEAELAQRDQEGLGTSEQANAMLMMMIAKKLGIDMPAGFIGPPRPRPPGKRPPPNGTPSKS